MALTCKSQRTKKNRASERETTECDVRQIRERYHRGERPSDIAVDFPQIAKSTVRAICHGINWEVVVVGAA